MGYDIPIESKNKYGVFEDDMDELLSALGGGNPKRSPNRVASADVQDSDEVTADFLRKAGNPSSHYGE
jgi:hypothetical protein